MPIRKELAERGYSMERFVSRTCYARNGNAHNATPEYTWMLKRHGKLVGSAHTKRGALRLAEEE